MVEDELPPVRPARGRGSWTGLHRSGTGRSGTRRERPPPEFDDDLADPAGTDANGSDPESRGPAGTEPAIGTAVVPAVATAVVPVTTDLSTVEQGDHTWLDREAGPVVRPYTLVGGRSRPFTSGLGLLTHVEALYAPDADLVTLQPEHRSILSLTRTAISMAELAARLDLPVGVVRVLVGDLIQANLVSTFEADAAIRAPNDAILQAVIDGLRAL